MKFAGKVTARLGRRLIAAESDAGQLPPLYTEVADESDKPVGKIVDLYGSVARPYLTVLCTEETAAALSVGDELFVIAETRPEKPKKKFNRGYRKN
ncbi:MAG: RNA-binding protein [Methanocorpusculum sp.]|nr:RNA-binding protein [Methanocorpusculum sp.]